MPEPASKLPAWITDPLQAIAALPPDMLNKLAEIAGDEENLGRLTILPKVVADGLPVPLDDAVQIVSLLQWYSSRAPDDAERFRNWFAEAVTAAGLGEEVLDVVESLAGRVCFRIGAKALDLYLRSPNTSLESRITSDLRPVWDTTTDHGTHPAAVTIMHTLQLEYWSNESGEEASVFIAVSPLTIQRLIETCQEALKKHSTLERLIADVGVRLVRVGDDPE